MHKSYEFEDSHYLRSGKRYKVDCGYCFEHHCSSSSRENPSSPITSREEIGLIPPTSQIILVNHTTSSQTPPKG